MTRADKQLAVITGVLAIGGLVSVLLMGVHVPDQKACDQAKRALLENDLEHAEKLKMDRQIQVLYEGLEKELSTRNLNYQTQRLANKASRDAIDIEIHKTHVEQQAGMSNLTREQYQARILELEIKQTRQRIADGEQEKAYLKGDIAEYDRVIQALEAIEKKGTTLFGSYTFFLVDGVPDYERQRERREREKQESQEQLERERDQACSWFG